MTKRTNAPSICTDDITDETVLAFANAYDSARGQIRRIESLSEYGEGTVAAWRAGLAAALSLPLPASRAESEVPTAGKGDKA